MDYHALIISLFFALGCAPIAFFQGACPCCPTATVCSGACAGTLSTDDIYITLGGYAGSCAGLNGTTHILNNTTDLVSTCVWQKVVTDALGTRILRYAISNGLGGILQSVNYGTDGFQQSYGSPIDCENISGEVLTCTNEGFGISCTLPGTPRTVTVTK